MPSNKPMISVCITAYNHERYIAKALDSVLSQQGNFVMEILVGEDGSTDGTAAIVREYGCRYPKIIRTFFHDPSDKFFINGRQTGRKNFINNLISARGDYIALLDGDDYWIDNRKLEKQLAFLEENQSFVACCHAAMHVDKDGERLEGYTGHHDVKGGCRDFDLHDVIRKNVVPAVSVLFRNQRLLQFPSWFFKTDMADWPLHIISALNGKIHYVDEKLAAYRLHGSGVWADFRADVEKALLSEVAVWRVLREETLFAEHVPYIASLIKNQYTQLSKLALRQHDYRKAWHYWREQGANNIALAWRIARKQVRHLFFRKGI